MTKKKKGVKEEVKPIEEIQNYISIQEVQKRLEENYHLTDFAEDDLITQLSKESGRSKNVIKMALKNIRDSKKQKEIEQEEDKEVEESPEKSGALIFRGKYGMMVHIPNTTNYILSNFNYNFKTVWHKAGETVYSWNGKIYESNGKELIKTKVEELTHIHCKSTDATEVFEKIKRKTSTPKEAFNVEYRYINLENGVYDIVTQKFTPHTPKLLFTHIIPVKYDPSKDCPLFKKFLEEALYPEDIPVMQEYYGFCLIRNYFIKKGAICTGPKDTGKTLNQKVLIKFIGEENKCGLSLQKISSNNNFAKIALKDKLLNAYDDLSSEDLGDGGGFKLATGGGFISAEEKFGDTCEFKSYAKQFFCCNKIPPVKDNNDPAYFDRWIIFQFDNVAENIDPFLFEKMTTEEELSGILNWALEGLHRLLQNNKFSYKKTSDQIKVIMERSGNPLAPFVQDVLVKDEKGEVSKEDMFIVYEEYMKDKDDLQKLSKEQLGRRLPQLAHFVQSKRDAKERFWFGVKFNEKYARIIENNQKMASKPNNLIQNDTLDTSLNTIRDMENIKKLHENGEKKCDSSIYNMLCEKASNPSSEEIKEALGDLE